MKLLTWLACSIALGLGACRDAASPIVAPGDDEVPQASIKPRPARPIPGQYVVVFHDDVRDVNATANALAARVGGRLRSTYKAALKGMALELPDAAVEAVRHHPAVAYVEQNQEVYAIAEPIVQPNATVGLDRIDQRSLPLSGTYSYSQDGSGVRVYILDSGINFAHSDFAGRAVLGLNAAPGSTGGADCNGHGTHVAGTVGGTTYGVAKKATLYVVRVLDCEGRGSIFSLLDGVDWVTANRVRPAVANMSVGTGFSTTLNQAVAKSIASGVTYVVAAANSASDACNASPASVPDAITVAASDQNDVFAAFSNRGPCVDLVAPGVGITSAWIGSTDATSVMSGTSMASPHVAGAAALYLSAFPDHQPPAVSGNLITNATPNALTSVPEGTNNRLLFTRFLDPGPLPNSWSSRAPLLAARSAFALGSANGLLYAIGGNSGGGTILASVEEYNPTTNAWTRKAAMPAPRHDGNGATNINGLLYVPGGRNGSGTLTKTLYVYNPSTNAWNSRAALPVPSGCGGSVAISGQLYVLTGCTGTSGFTGLLHRYAPSGNTWTARATAPSAHGYPAVGVISGKLYVAGGTNASGTATATLHVYTPSTNSWATKAPMPSARFGAAGQVINGKLYVVGGTTGTGELASTLVYDPSTNAWTAKFPMPTARRRLGARAINGLLYAVGGRSGTTYQKTVERYLP
jgi:subtilisin family serine protease/N-acetylneuraminic acid mutarotase